MYSINSYPNTNEERLEGHSMKKDQNILKQGNMACLLRCFSKAMAQIVIWKQWEMTLRSNW